MTFVDAVGHNHERAGADARIVSLVPSITELLFDLGLGPQVVGRTGFCIHPRAAVRKVAKLGGTKDVDLEGLRALEPSHVILNIDENRREDADAIAAFVPNVVVTHPNDPRDNPALYRLLGGIFGAAAAAGKLERAFAEALAECTAAPAVSGTVLYLIWREPWMTVSADTYIGRMLELMGLSVMSVDSDARYPTVEIERLTPAPDQVFLSSEPYPFRQRHLEELRAQLPPSDVRLVDGEMFSWYGSRAIAGLQYVHSLAATLRGLHQPVSG